MHRQQPYNLRVDDGQTEGGWNEVGYLTDYEFTIKYIVLESLMWIRTTYHELKAECIEDFYLRDIDAGLSGTLATEPIVVNTASAVKVKVDDKIVNQSAIPTT